MFYARMLLPLISPILPQVLIILLVAIVALYVIVVLLGVVGINVPVHGWPGEACLGRAMDKAPALRKQPRGL